MDKVHCLKRLIACISGKDVEEVDGQTVCKLLDLLCNEIDAGNKYVSGEEIDTGKKWIDGKPIYRLVVNSTLGELATAINAKNPKTITFCYGQSLSMYGSWMQIPSVTAGDNRYKMDFLQSNSDFTIALEYGEYFKPEYPAYMIIEYTKK